MKYKPVTTILVLLVVVSRWYTADAEPDTAPARLSLEEAIACSASRNPTVMIENEKRTEARSTIKSARSEAFPQIRLEAYTGKYMDPGLLNSSSFSDFGDIPGFSLAPEAQRTSSMSVNLSQSLFTWGRIPSAIAIARLQIRNTDLALDIARLDIAAEVALAYYQVLLFEEQQEALTTAVATQREHVQITRDRFDVGDATRLDMLQAETAVKNLEPELIVAATRVKLARNGLNLLLDLDMEHQLQLTDSLRIDDGESIPPLVELQEAAIRRRPELRQIAVYTDMLKRQKKVVLSDLRPSLSLVGSWGYSVADEENLFKHDYESWSVGVSLSYPLFDGLRTNGSLGEIESRMRQQELTMHSAERAIELEVKSAYEDLIAARERCRAGKGALDQAREALRVARESYEIGVARQIEVLDSERYERQARLTLSVAKYDYLAAMIKLKHGTGLTLFQAFTEPVAVEGE
ncbi:TolC family protein [bacterium]|nr:TolC family protein [candidate division CSSED10-310 bacterium]